MEALKLRGHLRERLLPIYEHVRVEVATECVGQSLPPPPYSIAHISELIERSAVRYVSGLIDGKAMQRALIERPELAARWSLLTVDEATDDETSTLSRWLQRLALHEAQMGTRASRRWPAEVSQKEVAIALERTRDKAVKPLAEALHRGAFFVGDDGMVRSKMSELPSTEPGSVRLVLNEDADGWLLTEPVALAMLRWNILSCAIIVGIEKAVRAELHRPMIALDAGQPHHELLTGLVRASSARVIDVHGHSSDGYCELLLPGQRALQLTLPLQDATLSEAFTNAIRQWRSFLGLRHWAALQRLLSIEGERTGRVRWKLDEHIDALGFSQRWREDPARRKSVADEVSLLTQMELAVYAPDGTLRIRAPVLMPTAKIDAARDGVWALEGMEIQINPLLYAGVRDFASGKLGKHWHPAPAELARIDHVRFPHAISLGLVLPIRWRWVWAESGQDHLTLEAAKLLHLAGIKWSKGRPGRAWEALDRSLEELARIGELGRVEWIGDKHTLAAKVRLYPADWLLDRTVRGLVPVERRRVDAPETGAALAQWRKARKLSQVALAKELGVGIATVKRAELAPDLPLGRALVEALKQPGRAASTE
jgi:hypothetical protein